MEGRAAGTWTQPQHKLVVSGGLCLGIPDLLPRQVPLMLGAWNVLPSHGSDNNHNDNNIDNLYRVLDDISKYCLHFLP